MAKTTKTDSLLGTPQIEPLLLDAGRAAKVCGISRTTYLKLVRSGAIAPQPFRLGSRVLWSRYLLEDWIRAGCPHRTIWVEQRGQRL